MDYAILMFKDNNRYILVDRVILKNENPVTAIIKECQQKLANYDEFDSTLISPYKVFNIGSDQYHVYKYNGEFKIEFSDTVESYLRNLAINKPKVPSYIKDYEFFKDISNKKRK